MTDLAVRESTELLPGATETALSLPDGLSDSEWFAVGENLGRAHRASAWWIGDWINYGERAGYVSPETYDVAEALTGLKRKTLQDYAWVSREFASSIRIEDVPFKHHQIVAARPLKERAALLEAARESKWTASELRQRVPVTREASKVSPQRRHKAVISAATEFAKLAEKWDAEMCIALTPPEARKQLTILNKAAARLAEVIAAVEYRAATPHRFMGR